MNLRQGTLLQGGKYRIERFIKSGGFGCTYEAVHLALGKRVAIKEFFMNAYCNRDNDTGYVSVGTHSKKEAVDKQKRKFAEEARTLARMHHPGIVNVSDIFEENGTAYYVMDYIDGGSLGDLLNCEGALSEQRALGYIRQAAEALRYVHGNNRLHLDLKPSNMMLDDRGEVILIDFGVSKRFDIVKGHSMTPVGRSEGYAPGEQYADIGSDAFSPATDIYSLGATLYKLLTGVTPPSATLLASGGDNLDPLPDSISEATRKAIAEAMRDKKAERPQSVDAFLALLDGGSSQDEPTVLIDDDPTDTVLDEPVEIIQGQWGSYKVKESGSSEIIEIPVDDPLPIPDVGVLIELEQGNLSYSFFLNEGICNTIYVYRNGVKFYEEDWLGGIPKDVMDYLICHGFLSKVHWEREASTLSLTGDGRCFVKCSFSYSDGTEYTRIVEQARHGEHDLLLTAVEGLINTTSLNEWKISAERKTGRMDKVHMDDVSSVSFLYCEPSFPGWGSYKAEITATSIKVEFAVMGNVVKQHSFPFSKNKFRELKLKLDTLDLHVKDVTEPEYYTGCSSIQLTLRGATHTFSAGCLCSGDGEWLSGELRGNISMLQKVMQQTIPDFDRLWQAAKSAAEPKPTPRPQPSPKPQPKKNKTESPEVKNQWWPLINVLLYGGIMLSTLVWVSEAHIPLPGWIVGLLLVGMIGGYALFNKGRKRWGYVAWYAPLLLMLLWALLNMNAGEEEKVEITNVDYLMTSLEDSCAVISLVENELENPSSVKNVDTGYGIWTGPVRNRLPHGKGKIVFYKEYTFCGVEVSEDYEFVGNFENGKPSFGKIYDDNDKKIRTIVP